MKKKPEIIHATFTAAGGDLAAFVGPRYYVRRKDGTSVEIGKEPVDYNPAAGDVLVMVEPATFADAAPLTITGGFEGDPLAAMWLSPPNDRN